MSNKIELTNLEIHEYCVLDKTTGEMKFLSEKPTSGFTGLFFKDGNSFFAIYPTANGPKIYYKGEEYGINKNLHISLHKNGKDRKFIIDEYSIEINYKESPYIGMDVWSDEIDVDLFYMIEQSYKNDDFYVKFTLIS